MFLSRSIVRVSLFAGCVAYAMTSTPVHAYQPYSAYPQVNGQAAQAPAAYPQQNYYAQPYVPAPQAYAPQNATPRTYAPQGYEQPNYGQPYGAVQYGQVTPRVARMNEEPVAPPQAEAEVLPYTENYNQGGPTPAAGYSMFGNRGGQNGYNQPSYYAQGNGNYYAGAEGGCQDGSCGFGESCGRQRCRQWFGGVYALYMTRDHENEVWYSYDTNDLSSGVLGSHQADVGWQWGNELRFGATMPCHNMAWEVVFWGIYGEQGQHTAYGSDMVGNLNTSLDFGGLEYNNGTAWDSVNNHYDDAEMHRAYRHFEAQNVEINLLCFPLASCAGPCGSSCDGYGGGAFGGAYNGLYSNPTGYSSRGCGGCGGCGSCFSMIGSFGVRYMRLNEWMDFDTDITDTTFGNDSDELFYDIETENHLIGFQLGCAMNYQATRNASLYCDGKVGIYGNHIQHRSLIYGDGGFARVVTGLPNAGENFDVRSSKDDVAFIGELRFGGAYQFAPNWRLYGGYRVIGISGVALPTNQQPANFADLQGVSNIDSNGHMLLHGFQGGIEFLY